MVQLEEIESTLFGLVLKCGEAPHEFKPDRAVHISMAALDSSQPSKVSCLLFTKSKFEISYKFCLNRF